MATKLFIKDRSELHLLEKFMDYAEDYLPQEVTWTDLMPVVEKIGKMDEPFIKRMPVSDLSIFSTIEKVWKCVVDFIIWYNNQTK